MKLIKLTAKNFMPYAGSMEISFPTDPLKNVMLVFGDNMRGKTSLLNALRWTFYSTAVGRHSRPIPLQEIVNKEAAGAGDWTVETCLVFESGGDNFELRRRAERKAMVSKPTRPEDFEVRRYLRKNNMPMGDHLIDAEIASIAPEQTSRFFLFDGELLQEYESLLFETSEQGRKIKEAIERALGVPTLVRGREDLQTIVKKAQVQQNKDLSKHENISRLTAKQANLQAQIAAVEADIAKLNARAKETQDEISTLKEFIERSEEVHEAKAALDAAMDAQKGLLDSLAEAEADRLILIKDAWRELLRPMVSLKRSHISESQSALTNAAIDYANKANRIAQLSKSVADAVCDSCGQPLHQAQREAAAKELGALQVAMEGLSVDHGQAAALSAQLRDLDKLARPGPAQALSMRDKELAKLSVSLTKVGNEISELEEKIRGHDTAEIAMKRARKAGLDKNLGGIETDLRNSRSKLEKDEREAAMVAAAIGATPDGANNRSSKVVALSSALERVFAKSIAHLRDNLRVAVQEKATQAFKRMTTQQKYSGLRINDHYGLSILDDQGQEVVVRSAGAEQVVALSLIDGLARAGRSAGPIVMDTPFGRLDPKHRGNILEYLPTTAEQLVLLVHEGEVRRDVDLAVISERIGCVYEIKEVNARHSRIEKVTS